MVGCVIVHNGRIIGEGYHRAVGEAHAEVIAIDAADDPSLLPDSTLYVNLEPCSYHGRTPPCSTLILEKRISRVVVGMPDPNPRVRGGGMKILEERGVDITRGVLEPECRELNRRFLSYHEKERPWVVLKWARSADGFLDRKRPLGDSEGVNWITGSLSRQLVHKWRAEEQSVMVGTRTAMIDDPELTVRDWSGPNPLRIVIDREGKLSRRLRLFNGKSGTVVFTSEPVPQSYRDLAIWQSDKIDPGTPRILLVPVPPGAAYVEAILQTLYTMEIISVMVEGGAGLLNSFIEMGLWDEARVFTGRVRFGEGLSAPVLSGAPLEELNVGEDSLHIYRNKCGG
jgi:diaminohydroxyphosphoribosylaminopyrimidine deaminase/5-amino-6-(5-phosphoribosylamino)uracil reductase